MNINHRVLPRWCIILSLSAYFFGGVLTAYVSNNRPGADDLSGVGALFGGGIYALMAMASLPMAFIIALKDIFNGMAALKEFMTTALVLLAWASNLVYFYLIWATTSDRQHKISLKLATIPLLVSPASFMVTGYPNFSGPGIPVHPGKGIYCWMTSYALIAAYYFLCVRDPSNKLGPDAPV